MYPVSFPCGSLHDINKNKNTFFIIMERKYIGGLKGKCSEENPTVKNWIFAFIPYFISAAFETTMWDFILFSYLSTYVFIYLYKYYYGGVWG